MAHQVVLVLGAGKNVGSAAVSKFKSKGYKVAAVSRNPIAEVRQDADLVLSADFSDPNCFAGIFEQVEGALGLPNVVIYNAYSWVARPENGNPLSCPVEDFQKDIAVNTVSAYAAAQEAIKAFAKLPEGVHKTFLYTGNRGNTVVAPEIFSLGLTKYASWYLIQTCAAAFKEQGYRFYFVDERTPTGMGMMYISGAAHAEFFVELAEKEEQAPILATFVSGKGYVGFEGEEKNVLRVMKPTEVADFEYGKADAGIEEQKTKNEEVEHFKY